MNLLQQRILRDGAVRPGGVLKVDSFLNHQMDVALFAEMGREWKRRFADVPVNKILTIEASGIGIACVAAMEFGVPVVFDATHSVQLPGGLGNASGGRREFVYPLARAAAAVGIDVLFTEVHPRPDEAWSDGPNSLDFRQIREILTKVKAIHDLVGNI